MYTWYTFPAEDCKAPCKQWEHLSSDSHNSEAKWFEPSCIPPETMTMPLEDGATFKGRGVGKASIFSLTRTCPFTPPCSCTYFTAVNVYTITAPMPLRNACVFLSSHFQGKDPTVRGRWLLWWYKGSSALSGWFTAGPKLDPQHALSGPLRFVGCLSQAVQLNLMEKLLPRSCLFCLWRDWKNMLLLPYTKH